MKKISKTLGVMMIVSASIMAMFSGYQTDVKNDLSILSLATLNSAWAEDIPNEPYAQGCIDCPGGVKFFCAQVGWGGCFFWPCGGGYC